MKDAEGGDDERPVDGRIEESSPYLRKTVRQVWFAVRLPAGKRLGLSSGCPLGAAMVVMVMVGRSGSDVAAAEAPWRSARAPVVGVTAADALRIGCPKMELPCGGRVWLAAEPQEAPACAPKPRPDEAMAAEVGCLGTVRGTEGPAALAAGRSTSIATAPARVRPFMAGKVSQLPGGLRAARLRSM